MRGKKSNLLGFRIYKDKNGQNVYYDPYRKKGYIITSSAEISYNRLAMRYQLALAAGILIGLLSGKLWIGVLCGIVIALILALYFFFKFLPEQPESKKFKPSQREKTGFAKTMIENRSRETLITAVLLLIVCIFILIYSLTNETFSSASQYWTFVVLLVLSVAGEVFFIYCLVQKKSRGLK
jgi:MFS family permease